MERVAIVTALVLAEYLVIVWLTGQSRGRHGVPAPSMTGDVAFERWARVQGNTVEQLVVFLPALWLFAMYVSELWACVLGLVFFVGRALFARGYAEDPAKRGPGFMLTLGANMILTLGALIGATLAAF
ncbi:MAG: MAPEG family protein [Myxococcota bacterium]